MNFIAGAGDDRLRSLEAAGDDLALSVDIVPDLGDWMLRVERSMRRAPKTLLQLRHPLAELRLRLAGRARGGGEAAMTHHLREILQIVQVLPSARGFVRWLVSAAE